MTSLVQARSRWISVRILILISVVAVGWAAVAHKAFTLGVLQSGELKALAKDQYTRKVTMSARRGMITDRHGEELAVEVEIDSAYADPRMVEDPAAAAAALAELLGEDEASLRSKLASKRHFVWLKRRIKPDLAESIRNLGLKGVDLVKEGKRYYPSRTLAANVIGLSGVDSVGLEGVELEFDSMLRGRADSVEGLRDAKGRVIFSEGMFGPKGVVGNTVELTIDRTLQYIAEQELESTIRTFEAKAGHVIILDPKTGEILAMANWPTYNPNAIQKGDPQQHRNRAVLDVFEPGSTFKIFTLAAALNSGVVRPNDLIYTEQGRMEMFGMVLHDDHRDGWLNLTQCLKRSSNICFAKISMKLGKEKLYHYLRRFGFGEITHVDLPFESNGVVHHFNKWYDIDAATISFGQGVGVTGLQMASGVGAIANQGILMRPMLVKRIVGPDGETVRNFSSEARRQVVSRYTARLVGDMMTAVTEDGGTGIEGALDGFLVAGKTGTAQKSEGAKGYQDGKWVASFIGFVPLEKPKLVITVVIDEPVLNHYGGTVAAPAMSRIADRALRYLGVSPTRAMPSSSGVYDAAAGEDKGSSKAVGPVLDEDDGKSAEAASEVTVVGPGQVLVPDVGGMTMKQAMDELSKAGIRPIFMGTGIAVEQTPPAGDPIDIGGFMQVNFQPIAEEESDEKIQTEEKDADRS